MARFPGISSFSNAMVGRALIVVASLVLAGCAMTAKSSDQAQRQAVDDFYTVALDENVHGLPTEQQLARLAPLMAPELLEQIEQAREQQAIDSARHQGTEPPLVQGALFFSLFEGAQAVVAIEPSEFPMMWAVTLRYGQGTDQFDWTDIARVGQFEGRWVIEDIEFMGQWDFARSGWLSNALREVKAQMTP